MLSGLLCEDSLMTVQSASGAAWFERSDLGGLYDHTFYSGQVAGSMRSAGHIVAAIQQLVKPRSVVDVGCGPGAWLSAFVEVGVTDVIGLDGAHVRKQDLLISPEHFVALDLRESVTLGRTFDLTICLEVGEHLPQDAAPTLVGTLTSLSSYVLFSAAIPGQGGHGHVNEQWQDWWAHLFANEGFAAVDCIRPLIWDELAVDSWYVQNIILYVRRDVLDERADLRTIDPLPSLAVVHPRTYMGAIERELSLGDIVHRFLPALSKSVRHRVLNGARRLRAHRGFDGSTRMTGDRRL